MDRLSERLVSERMFSRNLCILESLLHADSNVRIIERHLSEINDCWKTLQKAHDIYVVENFTDASDIEANNLYLNSFTKRYLEIEASCEMF